MAMTTSSGCTPVPLPAPLSERTQTVERPAAQSYSKPRCRFKCVGDRDEPTAERETAAVYSQAKETTLECNGIDFARGSLGRPGSQRRDAYAPAVEDLVPVCNGRLPGRV